MDGGCLDIAISNQPDILGLNRWSIHLYKQFQDPAVQAHGTNPVLTVFECVGNPHHYLLGIVTIQDVIFDLNHLQTVCITEGMVNADFEIADETLREVPVDNTSDEFTSQIWVLDALDALYDVEVISNEDFAQVHEALADIHQSVEDIGQDYLLDILPIVEAEMGFTFD